MLFLLLNEPFRHLQYVQSHEILRNVSSPCAVNMLINPAVLSCGSKSHKMLFRIYHNIYDGLVLKWNYLGVCICNSAQHAINSAKDNCYSFFFFFSSFNKYFSDHLLCAGYFDNLGRKTNNKIGKVTTIWRIGGSSQSKE